MRETVSAVASSGRMPLQEHTIDTNKGSNGGMHVKMMETPVTQKANYGTKMSTPPESIFVHSKKTQMLETPIKHSDIETDALESRKSALLSPAFSSPNSRKDMMVKRAISAPPKPSFEGSNNSSFSSDDDPNMRSSRRKQKRTKKEIREQSFNFDSEDKPPYSYATLIGMSILSNEEKRLTLSQIYSWISDTFKYYKRDEVGWQNSIRHNLSLNKAFIKGEKSKDGKGHFWCIKEGCEEQFLKSKSKRSSYQEVMDHLYAANKSKELKSSMHSIPSSPNISNEGDEPVHRRSNKRSEIEEAADYANDAEYEDDLNNSVLEPAAKKVRLTLNDESEDHTYDPNLGAPFGHVSYPKGRSVTTPLINTHTPHFVVSESPNRPLLAGKNLTYTSSFSCNSNLELSPIRPSGTGPLLEPLTPANNIYTQQTSSSFLQTSSIQSKQGIINHHQNYSHHYLQKTPKSNTLKTPLRNLRTPQTNSIMKKLWHSPSYLEEFYYSPLVGSSSTLLNSYDEDDMIMRNIEQHSPNNMVRKSLSLESSRNLINEFKSVDNVKGDSSRRLSSANATDIDD